VTGKRSSSGHPKVPCLNCDRPAPPIKGQPRLYCSEGCAEEAKTIRYVRGCIRDGRIEKQDIQEAVRIRLAMVIGGGYPEKERQVPSAVRKAVIAREHGRCKLCGKPGTDIDHIEGSSNKMENLQLLCRPCHNAKTVGGFVPIAPEHKKKAKELSARINARKPLRPCDDDERWARLYVEILAERKAAIDNVSHKSVRTSH